MQHGTVNPESKELIHCPLGTWTKCLVPMTKSQETMDFKEPNSALLISYKVLQTFEGIGKSSLFTNQHTP